MTHAIGPETIHNWKARYCGLPYFTDLTPAARAAIMAEHDKHHTDGKNAADCVRTLIESFPDEFAGM